MELGDRLFREEWIESNNAFKWFKKELLSDYEWFDWRIHFELRAEINQRLYNMRLARSVSNMAMNFKWGWGW